MPDVSGLVPQEVEAVDECRAHQVLAPVEQQRHAFRVFGMIAKLNACSSSIQVAPSGKGLPSTCSHSWRFMGVAAAGRVVLRGSFMISTGFAPLSTSHVCACVALRYRNHLIRYRSAVFRQPLTKIRIRYVGHIREEHMTRSSVCCSPFRGTENHSAERCPCLEILKHHAVRASASDLLRRARFS